MGKGGGVSSQPSNNTKHISLNRELNAKAKETWNKQIVSTKKK